MNGAGRVWLCGRVKLSTLNSAVILELMTGGWESGSALQALLPEKPDFPDPSIQNLRTQKYKCKYKNDHTFVDSIAIHEIKHGDKISLDHDGKRWGQEQFKPWSAAYSSSAMSHERRS